MQHKGFEAHTLATKIVDRYGRLALSRAAGEAAAAEKHGDMEGRDLWVSVVSYLRETIQQHCMATA